MLGVCYYPEHWPEAHWASDARRMAELGIRVVRVGEFAWAALEPERGRFTFAWLHRALDTLHAAGLQAVLGTPTATPPAWLVAERPEILPVDRHGRRLGFGSRRHYDVCQPAWWAETERIVAAVAAEFGQHPAVVGWQTDNEFGCHDTALSFSAAAREGFQAWLAERYDGIDALNAAWGNAFWSMAYTRFDQIGLPNLTPADANPAHWLDFRRYLSATWRAYNARQVELIRQQSPGRWVTHNFMGFSDGFDHWELAGTLDLASWDSYPIGFTEAVIADPQTPAHYQRTGLPDIAGFHHDLYRGVGRGRFWVMEQQPGPVNWAPWNPAPPPGQVRLWTWEAWAHGAEVVSYFRWRQCPFGQEQMHSGLLRPDDSLDQGGAEAAQVAAEAAGVPAAPAPASPVALVFDYVAAWAVRIEPHGADFNYFRLVLAFYEALRAQGLDVDVVSPSADLAGYRLVVAPSLPVADAGLATRLQNAGGAVLLGPRSGSKTPHMAMAAPLPPGPLSALVPLRVERVESLRPDRRETVALDGASYGAGTWKEGVTPTGPTAVRAAFADGQPALLANGPFRYLATWLDPPGLQAVVAELAGEAGLAPQTLPAGVRVRRRGPIAVAVNYSDRRQPTPAPDGARFVLGGSELAPSDVAAWQIDS